MSDRLLPSKERSWTAQGVQMIQDEATKPLHAEIERLRAALNTIAFMGRSDGYAVDAQAVACRALSGASPAAQDYCVCGKSQLAKGQHGYYCTGCGKDLHPGNYTDETSVTPEFAAGFERGIIEKVLKDVEGLTQGRTDPPFWAGVSTAVEEITTRLQEAWRALPVETEVPHIMAAIARAEECTCPDFSYYAGCPVHGPQPQKAPEQPERRWRGIVAHDPKECGPCDVELQGIEERAAQKTSPRPLTRPERDALNRAADASVTVVDTICSCGKRLGEHPNAPPWWPCMTYTNEAPAHPPILPKRFNSVSQPEKASEHEWVTITVQCVHCGAFASSPESCDHTVGCPVVNEKGDAT